MLWKLYVIALPVFFAVDMVWLGLVAKGFCRQELEVWGAVAHGRHSRRRMRRFGVLRCQTPIRVAMP